MAVNITWSLSEGGAAITSLDHGSDSNGTVLASGGLGAAGVEIWISHDGSNPITNAGFYIAQKSGTYTGGFTASKDLAEQLAWGDGNTANAFGGFQINMDKVGSYATAWPTHTNKFQGTPKLTTAFYTGVGDSIANKVLLHTSMGADVTSAGVLAAAGTACAFKCRIAIPADEDTIGIRQFDQKLRYTYSS